MAEKRTVSVWIFGQEYRVRSDSDEESIRRAAAFVDETMGNIRDRTGAIDSLNIAVLAALNISKHLMALREKDGVSAGQEAIPLDQLKDLIRLVESAVPVETSPTSAAHH
jgi:cell division protein ZapA (FtsZ GTPase activity inhibitor)